MKKGLKTGFMLYNVSCPDTSLYDPYLPLDFPFNPGWPQTYNNPSPPAF